MVDDTKPDYVFYTTVTPAQCVCEKCRSQIKDDRNSSLSGRRQQAVYRGLPSRWTTYFKKNPLESLGIASRIIKHDGTVEIVGTLNPQPLPLSRSNERCRR